MQFVALKRLTTVVYFYVRRSYKPMCYILDYYILETIYY